MIRADAFTMSTQEAAKGPICGSRDRRFPMQTTEKRRRTIWKKWGALILKWEQAGKVNLRPGSSLEAFEPGSTGSKAALPAFGQVETRLSPGGKASITTVSSYTRSHRLRYLKLKTRLRLR